MPPVALTSSVVDHHWLGPVLLHLRTDHARDDVVAATGREADDDADGFWGIALSASTARRAQQRACPIHGTCVFHTASPRAIRCDLMTAHRVGLPGPETGCCQHHYRWGTIFHRRAFTNNADPKKGLSVFFSVAKEKGEYLDQPRIRRICVIASLLDVITSRYKAKFVDQPFPLWNYSSEICAANAEKRKRLVAGRFCHPSPSKKGRPLAGSRFLRRTRTVRRPRVSHASHWPRTPRPSPFCIRSR